VPSALRLLLHGAALQHLGIDLGRVSKVPSSARRTGVATQAGLSNHALAYLNRWEEAEPLLRRALDIFENALLAPWSEPARLDLAIVCATSAATTTPAKPL